MRLKLLGLAATMAGAATMAAAAPALPVPPGATAAQVAQGQKVFATTTCLACHGEDGMGGDMAPALDTGTHLWTDGSLPQIHGIIEKGVEKPKQFSGPMPPMGGAGLSPEDLAAVSAYVWALGHQTK
jgi:mono/diheme cytochrome c family protein